MSLQYPKVRGIHPRQTNIGRVTSTAKAIRWRSILFWISNQTFHLLNTSIKRVIEYTKFYRATLQQQTLFDCYRCVSKLQIYFYTNKGSTSSLDLQRAFILQLNVDIVLDLNVKLKMRQKVESSEEQTNCEVNAQTGKWLLIQVSLFKH